MNCTRTGRPFGTFRTTAPVPLPASLPLLLVGLGGLGLIARKKTGRQHG